MGWRLGGSRFGNGSFDLRGKSYVSGLRVQARSEMIAALFVDPTGTYSEVDGIDIWDEARDARNYRGPHPVIAHPPCQRWGKFWHGSTAKPHQFNLGEDGGCFASALASVRNHRGVIEHPAHTKAWRYF